MADEYLRLPYSSTQLENAATNQVPRINANNKHWERWDIDTGAWVDTNTKAQGDDAVSPNVEITTITGGHSVTITDEEHPSGQTFNVMDGTNGTDGTDGTDGVSPEVTITTITGGHSVTITDADHPSGQTFNVMDGTGDMSKSVYDPQNTVANAGGIVPYFSSRFPFVEDTTYSGCFYRNVTVNNQTVKEWLNPPVVLNTEYRTMERFLGKPVYCKAVTVNLPTAQNASATTDTNISNLDVFISVYGTVTVNVNGNRVRINLPDVDTKATGVFVIANALDGKLYTQYAMTYTPESATAVVKYTKTTD